MDFIKDIWVSQERTKAGFRTEVDRPAAVLNAREIGWISVAEFSPAKGDEVLKFLWLRSMHRHLKNYNIQAAIRRGSRAAQRPVVCAQENYFAY